jgi:hypothetical protein
MRASPALPFFALPVICHLKLGIDDNFPKMLETAMKVMSSNKGMVT